MLDLSVVRAKISSIPQVIPRHTDAGHFYEVPSLGKTFGSVTKELQTLKDPGLTNWKMNRALDYIKQQIYAINPKNIDEHIFHAKEVPVGEFQEAGDVGTTVHNTRERYFKDWIQSGKQPKNILEYNTDPFASPDIVASLRAIERFTKEQNYTPIACEILVFDNRLQLAGTLDDIGLLGLDLVLMDLKTSNQIKPHYWLQVAMYYKMFYRLTKIKIKNFYILNTSKKNDSYTLEPIREMGKIQKYAEYVIKTNRGMDHIQELRKPQREVI